MVLVPFVNLPLRRLDSVEEISSDSGIKRGGEVDTIDKIGGLSLFTGADNDGTELSSVVSKGSV